MALPGITLDFNGDAIVTRTVSARTAPLVWYVGENHKPGLSAFDFSTYSGKVVQQINRDGKFTAMLTNLIPLPYWPKESKVIDDWSRLWWVAKTVLPQDVIVLFGKKVQWNFVMKEGYRFVDLAHPSSFWARRNRAEYIADCVTKIKAALEK